MAHAQDLDPRLEPGADDRDVRPVVERPARGLSNGAIALFALIAALALFLVLNSRRQAASAPAVVARADDMPSSAAPPALYIPPEIVTTPPPPPAAQIPPLRPTPPPLVAQSAAPSPPTYVAPPIQQPSITPPAPPLRTSAGPTLVVDISQTAPGQVGGPSPIRRPGGIGTPQLGANTDRVRAGMLANRSATVPQGTLIPAVLETAFDSTRPGFARALVQRDIRGFDGSRVLIPRGSRLIGEYGADTAPGQKRAMIAWSRLIRPDGVTVALDSPAADPLGRGGVRAKVNSHFFERFAGAILQSALDVGVNLAARSSDSAVVVLPGGTTNITGAVSRPAEIRPTLTVAAGRSVSVFVARDLDFSDARAAP